MLKPSMQDLMKKVDNRYLLVNLAAQRARDISDEQEEEESKTEEKPIKIALDEICDGTIEYREGPKPKPEPEIDILAAVANMGMEDDDSDLITIDGSHESASDAPDASDDVVLEDQ